MEPNEPTTISAGTSPARRPGTRPGPLVEPGAELDAEELMRYSRQIIIPEIGMVGQRRLKNAKVLVIGAGGLGSPALLYLAAAGVGTIGIIDDDVVDVSNLQRQVIHAMSSVGRLKTESAAARIRELNPLVAVNLHSHRLDVGNVLELFAQYDVILDGTDNFATRYLVNDAAAMCGKPYVWGSILRFDGQVSVFWDKFGPNYRDLYPTPPPAGTVPSCSEGGVFGVLCAQVGFGHGCRNHQADHRRGGVAPGQGADPRFAGHAMERGPAGTRPGCAQDQGAAAQLRGILCRARGERPRGGHGRPGNRQRPGTCRVAGSSVRRGSGISSSLTCGSRGSTK